MRGSDLLAPLSNLTGKTSKFQWTEKHTETFDKIKRALASEVQLRHPDFSEPFKIHTDASKHQLGAVITQENEPMAFFSGKPNKAQRNCTVTELESLAMVETLKEFCSVPLGQTVTVHTDHKNLTCEVFNAKRVMRWRLMCKECGPNLVHLKDSKNVAADALS